MINPGEIDDVGVAKGKGFNTKGKMDTIQDQNTICLNCTINLESMDEEIDEGLQDDENLMKRSTSPSLLTRLNFYQILIDKFQRCVFH